MARRRRKYGTKSLELLLTFIIGSIFLIYFILMIIVGIINQIIASLSKFNAFQWGFALIMIVFTAYMLMKYRKYKVTRRNEAMERAEEYRVKERKRELIRLGTITQLKQMNPYVFEQFIASLFSIIGYQCEVTKRSGDGGKDIILRKEDEISLVECKRYNGTKVGRPDIQKFHSAIIEMNAKQGFFVTTGEFTNQALECAKQKPIELINGSRLLDWIEQHAGDIRLEENPT